MVVMHVDKIPDNSLLTYTNQECIFGGNLSIRKNPNEWPLFSFGHDECIFCQFIFTNLAWKGRKGEQAPIPKEEGYGLMVSAFQSREFGLGMSLTADQLAIINAFQNEKRPTYTEKESALKVNGSEAKRPLTNSPFLIFFEYGTGSGKEGYWTYDHMSLQFEDCVDCIATLFPEYNCVWLFDHSCGHDRSREMVYW